ncbi:MAG: fumarate hydratase [Candidatus Omnitrophota bacterium]
MRIIPAPKITEVVAGLCIKANLVLRSGMLSLLEAAHSRESNKKAKAALAMIIKNASIAKKEKLAICQDTGMAIVFVEAGGGVRIEGDLKKAINKGVEKGYKKGYLRASIAADALWRGKPGYAPAVIHTDIVKGDKLKITVLVKGFGCENKSRLMMFNPTAKLEEIKKFIVEAVRTAGADACPPYVVGIGIGGTADYACLLAKKALLKKLNTQYPILNTKLSQLEHDLLREINKLNIGPMGLGGRATALAVNILNFPTHIAGLPVAVSLNCHALRSAAAVI